MKYLVTAKSRGVLIPKDQALGLYKLAIAWVDSQIKSGTVDCMYIFPQGGGMAIGNANSQEEAFDLLCAYPLYGFFDWQIDVLVDWRHGYNSIIEMYTKMGAT